jgi:CubicO group peptidase (beta-lactamase class C family)
MSTLDSRAADGALGPLLDTAHRDVERGRIPACQLAVARNGELLAFETFGDATNDTRFPIFSATKPLVASAIWLLLGEGKLDLGRPVRDRIPEFATNGKSMVTLEQVLLHTAGFPTAPMAPDEGIDRERRRERFAQWRLDWEPGTRFEYHAGSAHWVLADLIETASGLDFRDYIEQRVCRPLGLPRVLGIPAADQRGIAELVPVGEASAERDEHVRMFNDPDVRAAGIPGGGAIMTAADLARFYQALMHDPARVWDPAVLSDATANVRCRFTEPMFDVAVNRTIGLVVAGDDGKHVLRYAGFGEACSPSSFGHAGAHMQIGWADPASGLSFAYLTNGLDGDQMREGARGVRLASLAAAV